MTAYVLTQFRDHDPRLDSIGYATAEGWREKLLPSPHDVPDVLAWCSTNDCRASFCSSLSNSSARVYVIVPADDDAAFAFRMAWC